MKRIYYTWLALRAMYELVRYDVVYQLFGFGRIQRQLTRASGKTPQASGQRERTVCDAVLLATCLYWKPVLCLQRSVCAVRLLRAHGVGAHLVIGYRPVPFLSHAWVEVDGRVVNDSPVYRKRLRVLHTV